MAEEVRQGKWGNDPKRKESLIKAGYDYAAIQREVNRLEGLKVPSKPNERSVSVGDTVTTKSLYTTGHSAQNVRSSSIQGYVDRIDIIWRNPIRLKNKKDGYYLGFTRQSDVL